MVDDIRAQIYRIISEAEGREGVVLTPSAREMLAIPVMERFETANQIDWAEVRSSVRQIIGSAKLGHHPAEVIDNKLSAIAIIRGFYARFCNIPPFCLRRGTRVN